MQIRYLDKKDDRYAISRIYEEGWKHAYKGIIPDDYLNRIKPGQWANNLDIEGWHNLVCIENDSYIATSTFSRSRDDSYPDWGEIISIYVLPEYIGKGYGNKLLKTALDELKKMGFNDVFLWVLEENHQARSFYEKNGFMPNGDRSVIKLGGKELTEVRYIFHFE
ncbi:MAG: GNAT family N-acetyltransferase [Erysipelotrichaceae bacterium]|nr:GNAT family N-acetyltransferase [Erysipelotrichaceae bacterium]